MYVCGYVCMSIVLDLLFSKYLPKKSSTFASSYVWSFIETQILQFTSIDNVNQIYYLAIKCTYKFSIALFLKYTELIKKKKLFTLIEFFVGIYIETMYEHEFYIENYEFLDLM